uniref:Uncharacterized protein n=1 Tax=Anguilla anguilla TaxID=7936 RepID=A0A0E9S4L3_ANGAN
MLAGRQGKSEKIKFVGKLNSPSQSVIFSENLI